MDGVKINPKSIADVDMNLGCRALKSCIERMLADPAKRAEFEEWKQRRAAQEAKEA